MDGVGVGDGREEADGDAEVVGEDVGDPPPLAQAASTSPAATSRTATDETLITL